MPRKGRGGDAVDHRHRSRTVALASFPAASADAFRNQYLACHADIAGEKRKALDALRTDPVHRQRYDHVLGDIVYGEQVEFDEAMGTVADLVGSAWRT